VSNHGIQINGGFPVKTAPKNRFQPRSPSGQVGVQVLGRGLTRRSFLEFALSLGRLRRSSLLALKLKRLLTIPPILAVSALLARQAAPPTSGPEQGRYRRGWDTSDQICGLTVHRSPPRRTRTAACAGIARSTSSGGWAEAAAVEVAHLAKLTEFSIYRAAVGTGLRRNAERVWTFVGSGCSMALSAFASAGARRVGTCADGIEQQHSARQVDRVLENDPTRRCDPMVAGAEKRSGQKTPSSVSL
jgi:hypothetical protein